MANVRASCVDKAYSIVGVALVKAYEGYYVTEGQKELFFSGISMEMMECTKKKFIPLYVYEEKNNLHQAFQVGGDHTGSDSYEARTNGSAQGSVPPTFSGSFNASEERRSSNERFTPGKLLPPRSVLRRQKGYNVYACKFEVSVVVNFKVTFSKWSWWDWWNSSWSKSNRHLATINETQSLSVFDVLRKLDRCNEARQTAQIEFVHQVESEYNEIDSLDAFRMLALEY